MWEDWDLFNKNYSIKDRDYWNKFWDECTLSDKEIYFALRNISYACDQGYYESRYVSPYPDQFIKGGMLHRSLNGELSDLYDMDHPDWENPDSEYYDTNLRVFK